MKKISLLFVLLSTLLLITGCNEKKEENKNIEGTLTEIIEKVYKDLPAENTPNGLSNIELNDENIENYIGTKDIEYKEAIARESMIGAIAHSVVLLRTEENADIESIKETILENVNPRKWVCVGVEKDDVIIKNKGDLLIVIIIEDEVGRDSISKGFDALS